MQTISNRLFKPGNKYLVAFLTFLSAFPPLTSDMYLPALPEIARNLATTNEFASYTLSAFFLVYAFTTLVWGPISDKYGRRRVLIIGTAIYILSSVAIILVTSIWQMLWLRCLQAIGCAAASAMSLAIVKDVLRGSKMEKIVSLMQAAHILAPLTAPILGGLLLYVMDWRGIFGTLAFFGLLALIGSLALAETGRAQTRASVFRIFARVGTVLKHRVFMPRLLLFSFLVMPFFSFLAASAFVYQNEFSLSAQTFSWFFAFNACFSLAGPLLHLAWLSKKDKNSIITMEIAGISLAGLAMIAFGNASPYVFALLMAPITLLGSAMRPPSTVLMMECIKGDNGIVASLIQCGAMLCGSLAMYLATLPFWSSAVVAIGTIAATVGALSLCFWLSIKNQNKPAPKI